MENIKTLLIADRGEIAVVYTPADSSSQHVHATSSSTALPLSANAAYTDTAQILALARTHGATAIAPGYGFLSESASFARAVHAANLTWLGPSASAIETFGAKHAARAFAARCGVPVVPGSGGLVRGAREVREVGERVGWPVVLKASCGGGGMGLAVCEGAGGVEGALARVTRCPGGSDGGDGVVVEKYVPRARHVEVQVFGNGRGDAVHFGERECSVQRRHQKVVEECPSPFVVARPELRLRERLTDAAVRLARAAEYGSVGTVEFLVDEATGDFFFLEMNTRLQVEHGVTELCYGVDLVELMLRQADAEAAGRGGLSGEELAALQKEGPVGAAVEVRVYAENPVRDFAPAPGLLQCVRWGSPEGFPGTPRIDTWVKTGTTITPHYDPLIGKLLHHSPSRATTIAALTQTLHTTTLHGPPTNLFFLASILSSPAFLAGATPTSFLASLPPYTPHAIDVLAGGALTTVQDLPGRPRTGNGIPPSGPMDGLALQLANLLVGNLRGTAGLEMTLAGPTLRVCAPAVVVALCGADAEAELDGAPFPPWTRRVLRRGQTLRVGRVGGGGGCRAYLAVRGGLPGVPLYCGSRSTAPALGLGGYQGRGLAAGDLLEVSGDAGPTAHEEEEEEEEEEDVSLPERLRPLYAADWTLAALPGPHTTGFLTPAAGAALFASPFTVSHNASRSGIRLAVPPSTPPIQWARETGGDGGAHPSNVVEYGYAVGALNWAGDTPCLFPVDGPDFGGFVSVLTVVGAEHWKMGQLRPGDRVRFVRVGLGEAGRAREGVEAFLGGVEDALGRGGKGEAFAGVEALRVDAADDGGVLARSTEKEKAIVARLPAGPNQPRVTYRQSGDSALLVSYSGGQTFSLALRARVALLRTSLSSPTSTPPHIRTALLKSTPCCASLLVHFTPQALPQHALLAHLQTLETRLRALAAPALPTRQITLPLAFASPAIDKATAHYAATQRAHAPFLPSNSAYVARSNGLTEPALRQQLLATTLVAVAVGFFAGTPVCLPLDPRHRLRCAKMSPPRVGGTPAGSLGWGGGCAALYPVEAPGGYALLGRTVPVFGAFGGEEGGASEAGEAAAAAKVGEEGAAPTFLLQPGDMLTFREVGSAELDAALARFRAGLFVPEVVETVFDVLAHERLLEETEAEAAAIRARQAVAEAEVAREEEASLEMVEVDAPMDANVWKVEVGVGDVVMADQVIAVLEAMKLEIAVRVPENRKNTALVERVLVRPGEMVRAGQRVAVLRLRG
ncbi:uncharacterized protein K452DRAFT_219454 [Aplosporella prunicola CBS 121167]|uniref:Urea carboxylase n=1 Tax=Aplosporella prunicola CBS 121167 TaxID=1176127 RepID=A0A6A6BP51_9PEZI|nr:uncharacterized protein K452DRAFT_219454 [Aplosporella prunicola CBS 121167]KAF2145910.1 hypothetical protein K452DRAFT_219454 [Aplosporella prunicola CBS 121167]